MDDPDALAGIVYLFLAIIGGFVLVSMLIAALATVLIARWARKHGRQGSRIFAFLAAVGAEVFILTALNALFRTHQSTPPSSTGSSDRGC